MAYRIDKDRLKMLEDKFLAALAPIAAENGVSVSWGGGHYGDTADLKLKIATVSDDGTVESEARTNWLRKWGVESRGMQVEWLDKVVTLNGKAYRIEGLSPTRRKYCVECVRLADGKTVFWTAAAIIVALGAR